MSLKSLIQRLLDSRTTPEEAGHSAMPSPTEVSLTPSVTSKEAWGDVCTGTASSDGYIRMSFSATSPEALGSARSFGAVVFSTPQLKGDIVSVVCPVAKGKAYAMSARNANNITCAFVKLIGAIGGGHKHFVRRTLSCLRPSFNYLPRSFCKAKNSGLAVKHSLKQLLHWMFRHVPSLHRLMGILDTSILSAVEANSCSIWIRVKKYLAVKSLVIAGFLQQTPTARQQYLSRKAVLLLLLPTRCSIKFGLLRLQARHNLRTGGALC